MYARVISFSGADPEKRDKAEETIRGTVIPTLREYDGFAGYVALYDEGNKRARAIILWDSKETAEAAAAEETLQVRRRLTASGVCLTVASADLYEAVVVELEGAHV